MEESIWNYVSIEAKDLVNNLLCYDPIKRFDSKEIISHKWMKSNKKLKLIADDKKDKCLKNIKKFSVKFIF